MKKLLTASLALMILLVSWRCEGHDGDYYPSLYTDFLTAKTNSEGNIESVTLDDGSQYQVTQTISTEGKKDTTLRCISNYTIDKKTIDIYSIHSVYSNPALPLDSFPNAKKDPVKVTSVWKGNGYLNIHLGVLTTDKGKHSYGFCIDSVKGSTSYISLIHERPSEDAESYTSNVYLSLPTKGFTTDSLSFSIQTYDGIFNKVIQVSQVPTCSL